MTSQVYAGQRFKVPGYIAFVNELPLTASQKVSRGEIKALARHPGSLEDVFLAELDGDRRGAGCADIHHPDRL